MTMKNLKNIVHWRGFQVVWTLRCRSKRMKGERGLLQADSFALSLPGHNDHWRRPTVVLWFPSPNALYSFSRSATEVQRLSGLNSRSITVSQSGG